MQLIVITNPSEIKNECQLIKDILDSGLATIHFRKPSFSKEDSVNYLNNFSDKNKSQIVTHNYPDIAEECNLKGIHFTGNTKHEINRFKAYYGSKSISTHSFNEITAHESMDYYFLSPIFKSISKLDYGGNSFNYAELKNFLRNNSSKNIIALGGIESNNIGKCKEVGFKGVALLGSIWQPFQKSQNTTEIIQYLKDINKLWEQ